MWVCLLIEYETVAPPLMQHFGRVMPGSQVSVVRNYQTTKTRLTLN